MSRQREVRFWKRTLATATSVVAIAAMLASAVFLSLYQPISTSTDTEEPSRALAVTATRPPTQIKESPQPALSATPTVPSPSLSSLAPIPPVVPTIPPSPPARTCQKGTPLRLLWNEPGIQIDAPFVKIGRENDTAGSPGFLGSPASKKDAGWYKDGPMPGTGVGNVLIDAHTYRDNSAVFKENFSQKIATGMVVTVVVDNGSSCSYRIDKIWPNVSKTGEYPSLVVSERFYDFTGREQLFGVTCSGSWNAIARSHEAVTAFIAVPIN